MASFPFMSIFSPMDSLPPLFFHLDHGIRAHPGAERAADAAFLIRDSDGMITFGIDLLAQGKQMFGTNVGTEAAAFTGLAVNGQFGHGSRLLTS
jgi:hypothetical protein